MAENNTNATNATENLIQACWLSYDIPETADIPSPVSELRPIAFHAQKSVWIIREGDIPYMLVNRLRAAGADVQIIRFDPSEAPKLLKMCVDSIKKDIRQTIETAKKSADSAARRLAESDTPDKAKVRYNQDYKRILKVARQTVSDLTELAKRFGVTDSVPELSQATTRVRGIQAVMLERARAYATAVEELEAADAANPILTDAKASRVPVTVLAGMLADIGREDAAESLVSKFFG